MSRKEVSKELDKEQRIKRHNNKEKGKVKENRQVVHYKSKPKIKKTNKSKWIRELDEDEYYIK